MGLDFTDEVGGNSETDIVAEVNFVLAVHAIGGVGVGGAADPVATLLVFR